MQYKVKNVLFPASTQRKLQHQLRVRFLPTPPTRALTRPTPPGRREDWFSLDAGYSKLHLNTAGGIDYFASGQFITGQQSIYISNLHVAQSDCPLRHQETSRYIRRLQPHAGYRRRPTLMPFAQQRNTG